MTTLIAAADLSGLIGRDNALPWRLPADLQRFKAATMGKAIVMGRRTFQSLKRPLPGRLNVVLTRDPRFVADGVQMARSLDEAFAIGARHHDEVMVIGGAAVYLEAMPRCQRMLLTIVEGQFGRDVGGDVKDAWLPKPTPGEWLVHERTHHQADETNAWASTVYDLVRPSPNTRHLAAFSWPT